MSDKPAAEAAAGAAGDGSAAQPGTGSKWAVFVAEMDKRGIEPDRAAQWMQKAHYHFETEQGRKELMDQAVAGREDEIGKSWFIKRLERSKDRRFLGHLLDQYKQQHGEQPPPKPKDDDDYVDDPYSDDTAPEQAQDMSTPQVQKLVDLVEGLQAKIQQLEQGQGEVDSRLKQTTTALRRAEQFKRIAEDIGVTPDAYNDWAVEVANKLDSGDPKYADDGSGNMARVAGEDVLHTWRHRGTLAGLEEPTGVPGALGGPSAAVLKDATFDKVREAVAKRDAGTIADLWVSLDEAEGAL